LEEEAEQSASATRSGETLPQKPEMVTVEDAVKRFLVSKRIENLRTPRRQVNHDLREAIPGLGHYGGVQ
jgi:hypothetical protein